MADELNADRQSGGAGEHGQRDARSIGPGRKYIERGVARAGQSRRSFSGRARCKQQVDVLHRFGELSAASSQRRFGFSIVLVRDVQESGEFLALELAQKIPMMLPFPGKTTGKLVISDAPAHDFELLKRGSEIEIRNLGSGLRQHASGILEELFCVTLGAVPEHRAAKADFEIANSNSAERLRGESGQRRSKNHQVLDLASEKPHGVEGRGILLDALRAHFAEARLVAG